MSDSQPALEGPSGDAALKRALMHGLAWTALAKWGVQLVSWAGTIVVARLLSPSDYGIVGMAAVYLGFVQLINEFGLATVIVQQRGLSEDELAKLGGLALAIGVLLFTLTTAGAYLVAGVFREPAVRPVISVLAVTFVTGGIQLLPAALLNRDLQFSRLAALDSAQALVSVAVTFVLALRGHGYWSLVLGNVAGNATACVGTLAICRQRIAWPVRLGSLAAQLRMGLHVVAARIAWYVYSNADFAVVGKVLGRAALGAYTIGWQLSNMPLDKIFAILSRVTLPVFSSLEGDHERLARYLRGMTEGLTLLTFPASVGIALVAADAVPVVLGPRWSATVTPLTVLSLGVGFRSLGGLFPPALIAIGDTRRNAQFTIVAAIVMPILFLAGSHWGLAGVATAWTVGFPLLMVPMFAAYTLRRLGVAPMSYFGWLWPAASGSALMAAVVLAAAAALPDAASHFVRLNVKIVTGVLAYGLFLVVVQRDRLRDTWALIRVPPDRGA